MTETIVCERQGATAFLVIRRPAKQNALTIGMVEELLAGLDSAGTDDEVKVIVIAGEGEAFCAGFDVSDPSDFQGGSTESWRSRVRSLETKAEWMRRFLLSPKPLVVSVQGYCIGIGTYLALAADFVIAAQDAAFGLPEERFGSAGATWIYPFLIREVGVKRANEIVMTGRRFSAAEFEAMGLLNRVVCRAELAEATNSLCTALASLPRDGLALNRAVKTLALATIGHLESFGFHALAHPYAELLAREPDEFDFMGAVESLGMRRALVERERAFGGGWWGW